MRCRRWTRRTGKRRRAHPVEQRIDILPGGERRGEDVRGRDRVLDGEIDADAAHWRHGMGGIADREQPGARPAFEPVERDREQLHLVPVRERVRHVREVGRGAGDLGAERRDALRAHVVGAAFRHDKGALPVIAAVELHDEGSRAEGAAGFGVRGVALRQAEPEHVDRRAKVQLLEAGLVAQRRGASIGGDGKPGADFAARLRSDPDDPLILLNQVHRLAVHPEVERWVAARLVGEEVEEMPLRHQRDELAGCRQVAEIRDGDALVGDPRGDARHLVVRAREKGVEQPQLGHQLERGGVDRVAAKVAQEIAVLFDHDGADPGASEEQPGHHPGRPAARHDEARLLVHGVALTAFPPVRPFAARSRARP